MEGILSSAGREGLGPSDACRHGRLEAPAQGGPELAGKLPSAFEVTGSLWKQEEQDPAAPKDKRNWVLHPINLSQIALAALRLPDGTTREDTNKIEVQLSYHESSKSASLYTATIGPSSKDRRLA